MRYVGRPRKETKRDQQLNLSLTEAEYAAAYYLADRFGMRLVDYGRWRLLADPTTTPEVPRDSTADRLLLAQIRRVGVNLNQLVRYCHSTGHAPPSHLDPLLLRIRELISGAAKG